MLKHFVICGSLKHDGLWLPIVAVKATLQKEAADLLQQYIISHLGEYTSYKIDDITPINFWDYENKTNMCCLVSKTAAKETEEQKRRLLVGAP